MGSFYTNVVLRGSKASEAVSALAAQNRRAIVAVVDDSTFVYDEICENQNVDDLRAVAQLLSRECGSPALAALNHDDDVLWLALARNGAVVDVYNSFPEFESGGMPGAPWVANLDALCEAFDATAECAEIESLLRVPNRGASQHHHQLLELLGIDTAAGLMGFNYVVQGELDEMLPGIELHEVGEG
jgi:hypothetical protein